MACACARQRDEFSATARELVRLAAEEPAVLSRVWLRESEVLQLRERR